MAVGGLLSSSQISSLIQQASAAYQLPAAALQTQEQPVEARISALGKVQGSLSSLQSSLSSLADVQTLSQVSVTTSPTGIVRASASNDAAPGSYALSNIHLAQAETLITSASASASASFGAGSLSIQLGSGSAVTIDVAAGQSTLSGIASAIDQANLGVNASVVFDGSGYHLVLTGDSTGAANAFTVSGSGGLSSFSYTSGASGLTRTQAATDASFSLNGITVTSGTNQIANAVPGLSITLAASGSATITVAQDTSSLDHAAQQVVGALNGVLKTINQFASYSPTSGAGPLLGNIGLDVIRSSLLNAISAPGAAIGQSAGFSSLASIGFGIASNGTVTLDDAAFQTAAKSNYSAVAALLGHVGVATNANVKVHDVGSAQAGVYAVNVTSNDASGIAGTINGEPASGTGGLLLASGSGAAQGLALQIAPGIAGDLGTVTVGNGLYGVLNDLLTRALATGTGGITGQIDSLTKTVASLNNQIAQLQDQARKETATLTAQFSAAQATLSQLSTVSDFLTTYFKLPSGGVGG